MNSNTTWVLAVYNLTSIFFMSWPVIQRPCQVLSCLCDDACKRSLYICGWNRALCPVSRLLQAPKYPECEDQGSWYSSNKKANKLNVPGLHFARATVYILSEHFICTLIGHSISTHEHSVYTIPDHYLFITWLITVWLNIFCWQSECILFVYTLNWTHNEHCLHADYTLYM